MIKKNTLNEEQLDRVRGGLEIPYINKNDLDINNKTSGLDLDISGSEPTNDNTLKEYVENTTKEQKFIL